MSFVSVSFAALYLAAMLLRFSVGRSGRAPLFLIGLYTLSLIFYGWHVPAYLALILGSTLTDFVAARRIEDAPENVRARRAWLWASVCVNLGLLGYFKYAGLLAEIASALAQQLGFDASAPAVELLLPIGISFYTFQSMSYTIDVYRGALRAERSFWRFGLYVSFFPQLVAGPIVRAGEFLYQLPRLRRPRARVFWAGTYLLVRGLFLKLVVADNLGLLVDTHWAAAATPGAPSSFSLALLLFFSCQLFCDFAGYSDMARGLAYQLGFRLPLNFDAPFLASSFREFWRRWHITLSEWMRDYLYIPLGGDRRGRARALTNLVIVIAVSGLWHGAHLQFALWGLVHGLAAAAERAFGIARGTRQSPVAGLMGFLVVQGVWVLSMALFRAADVSEAGALLGNVLWLATNEPTGFALDPKVWDAITTGVWFTLPVWALHLRTLAAGKFSLGEPRLHERAIYAGPMIYALLTLYAPARGFIYFQF